MATTILSSFQALKQNLEITDNQSTTVSTRQQHVRTAVEKDLTVNDSFLTGSYSRSTLISPLKDSDVDIFTVLHSKYFHHYNKQNGGQAGLLDHVKRTLLKTYSKTPDISRNGQAVTIRFEDFAIDVVPGFERKGGGYLIPNSIKQNWISTDPKSHVQIFSEANLLHEGNLIPIIKMIKAWNKNINKYFRSFHLEVVALIIFQNVTISDYPSGIRYFFDKGRAAIRQQNLDPAGYGGDVGYYIDTNEKITESVSKFQLAYERAIKAEDFANKSNISNAVEYWRLIFGNSFPVYG